MSEAIPIFIPSKGRAGTGKTAGLLYGAGMPFYIVVEPQDAAAYKERWHPGNVLVMPENDRGYGYVCEFIRALACGTGMGWYWMLDDDLDYFYHKDGKKMVKDTPEVLRKAEYYFNGPTAPDDLAQASLEFQQFAWSADKPFVMNGYACAVVANHAQRTRRLKYRTDLRIKNDKDFTLQILASGMRNVRITDYAFSTPKTSTNKGGLHGEYAQEGFEKAQSEEFARLWPGIAKPIIKKDGRWDVKIDWRAFSPQSIQKALAVS